jgi:predicted metal-dependent hydrolase
MINSNKVNIEGIGHILFERSARARRIIITVRPGKGVRVAVPKRASMESAMDFVRKKKEWIKKHLQRTREYEKQKEIFNDFFLSVDKKEARKIITGKLKQLAEQYGFSYGKVSIRSQRTRWGSCSGRGNISLNIKLVALPVELSDYVIMHELVHTRIHNHSRKFWKELDKYVGNGKAKARSLKEYGLGIL